MKVSEFSYDLPRELIAQESRPRGGSRMMIVTPRDGEPRIENSRFDRFPEQLERSDVLVLNDTRVIPARLFAQPKGHMSRKIELLLTREIEPMTWEAWCKPAKRVRTGETLQFSSKLIGQILDKREDGTVVMRLVGDPEELERVGVPPLPPYIVRKTARESDREAYQTVYARERGAIAAPTAGLHFTAEILEAIRARGVDIVPITLHVGIGTFKPVNVDNVEEHVMDAERYEISEEAASVLTAALRDKRRIVAVGTTTVRALESAIRNVAPASAGEIKPGRAETSIFITPGFEFRVIGALLTNFHLPQSTLLMLVSAFAGIETIRKAYAEAIKEKYLFYSYGDCMLIRF